MKEKERELEKTRECRGEKVLQNIFMKIFQEECIMMRLKIIRNTTERIKVEERREERRK